MFTRPLPAGLLLATLLPLSTLAQSNFQPGYVVRPAGDTLRGEVDSRDAYFNATQCRFRPAPTAEATTYRPAELRAYGVEGRAYRSLTPPSGPAPVFAEVLVSGPATLYLTRDAERNDHFYLEAPQFTLTELASKLLLLPGRDDYRREPVYRLTLAQALPNCPAAERQLSQLPLTAAALARVVQAFNQCRGVVAQAPPSAERARQRPRVGVVLGGHVVSMNMGYPNPSGYGQATLSVPNRTVPVLGATMSVPLGVLSRKLSLELALLYAGQQHYTFDVSTNGTTFQYSTLDVALGYVRLPALLRYSPLPQAPLRPVLEAGITLAYATTLDATTTSTFGQRTTVQPFYAANQEHLQEGGTFGAGLQGSYWQGRRATALFRLELDNSWLRGGNFNTDSNRFYLLLALDLTK